MDAGLRRHDEEALPEPQLPCDGPIAPTGPTGTWIVLLPARSHVSVTGQVWAASSGFLRPSSMK
jgi:hypothetical protein